MVFWWLVQVLLLCIVAGYCLGTCSSTTYIGVISTIHKCRGSAVRCGALRCDFSVERVVVLGCIVYDAPRMMVIIYSHLLHTWLGNRLSEMFTRLSFVRGNHACRRMHTRARALSNSHKKKSNMTFRFVAVPVPVPRGWRQKTNSGRPLTRCCSANTPSRFWGEWYRPRRRM